MDNYILKKLSLKKNSQMTLIVIASMILLYLLIALYFRNHYFPNTVINNTIVSFKSYDNGEMLMKKSGKEYTLKLMDREGKSEIINSQDMELTYNKDNSIDKIHKYQQPLKWIFSLFKEQKFYVNDLYSYNSKSLRQRIDSLICLNNQKIFPENVSFQYKNGSYEKVREVDGNIINRTNLEKRIKNCIRSGIASLDLNQSNCYERPRYEETSAKAKATLAILNKYTSTNVTYGFGTFLEVLNGESIHQWLFVDNNLDVEINIREVRKYVKALAKKYDTVGITREFKTSMGSTLKISGGLYGWKINQELEVIALLENIKEGKVVEKEPIYLQTALHREGNEIGDTYVEINITRQYLWFYKDGKLITQGSVVTGNPNRGNGTVTGVNMLNYKQKGVSLTGPGYEVGVTYWMPFYGNIGIHDAKWRNHFGGNIYKTKGSHGCVNAPLYLAKIIYEYIEEGIPIISYEEDY